ncbi:hypothetical protein PUR_25910 [Paenibacillus sp. URB8-2]|nr:hypothetical protein PUR_25910 [Paenibacillus sp. URB8-2]
MVAAGITFFDFTLTHVGLATTGANGTMGSLVAYALYSVSVTEVLIPFLQQMLLG